jgi:hypothetical protein
MCNKKHSFEYIKDQIEKNGYELLSKEYKNAITKLKMRCNEGHEIEITWNNFQQGKRCTNCFRKRKSNKEKLNFEYVKKYIENKGYKLLSKEYINARSNLKLLCSNNHIWYVNFDNFKNKKVKCSLCFESNKISIKEKEIVNFIKGKIFSEIIENDRTQIINPLTNKFLELDIFIPELNKAIEFNGEYWHSNGYSKYKDKIKQTKCKEKGINLLVIEERNWINDKNKCLNTINNFLGV